MSTETRFFSIKEFNKIVYKASYVIAKQRKYFRLVDKTFRSQIMATVSAVNSCPICSYVHTKSLIKSGTSNEELKVLLEGDFTDLNEEVSLALVFAQHYADEKGNYDEETFLRVIEFYGKDLAYGIMATIKMIMFGNSNGIALTNLVNRLRFRKPKNAKFFTDLYNGFVGYLLLPILIIFSFFKRSKRI